jgi:hypothetical protein
LMQFTTFHSCMYGSSRPKRTMLGFNAEEFAVINKQCIGVSKSHKHEAWGIHKGSNFKQICNGIGNCISNGSCQNDCSAICLGATAERCPNAPRCTFSNPKA